MRLLCKCCTKNHVHLVSVWRLVPHCGLLQGRSWNAQRKPTSLSDAQPGFVAGKLQSHALPPGCPPGWALCQHHHCRRQGPDARDDRAGAGCKGQIPKEAPTLLSGPFLSLSCWRGDSQWLVSRATKAKLNRIYRPLSVILILGGVLFQQQQQQQQLPGLGRRWLPLSMGP